MICEELAYSLAYLDSCSLPLLLFSPTPRLRGVLCCIGFLAAIRRALASDVRSLSAIDVANSNWHFNAFLPTEHFVTHLVLFSRGNLRTGCEIGIPTYPEQTGIIHVKRAPF